MKPEKRPTRCECGGKLIYSDGPGDYISVYCDACTPIIEVRFIPKPSASPKDHL